MQKGELFRARKKVGAGVDGTHCHSTFLLEQELQCELNQSRVIQLVVHNSEVRVVSLSQSDVIATCGAGGRKLDSIERVEKFGSELNPQPVIWTEVCCFE